MRTTITASSPMPEFIYMPLPDGKADVFIYKIISENEDGYMYESNEFRTEKLTRADIASDPLSYMDYSEHKETLEEKVKRLERTIEEMTYTLEQVSANVIEVVKKEDSEMPSGDYVNPIRYEQGMRIAQPLWYYLDDKDLPKEAIKSGYPTGWDDESFFA